MAPQSFWLVRSDSVDSCMTNDQVIVRFPIDNASGLDAAAVQEKLPQDLATHDRQRVANEVVTFVDTMQIDDVVMVPDKARNQYLVGRVNGDYEWSEKQHVRDADWVTHLAWETVPVEFKSIANYQRSVLLVNNTELIEACNEALEERLEKAQLRSLKITSSKRAATPKARKAAPAKPAKIKPESQERLCVSCGLKKHESQFAGSSEYCVDCA